MTINELVSTCQNDRKSSFKFDVIDVDGQVTYYFNSNYLDNDSWYLIKDEKVEYWRFEDGILTIGFNIWRVI